MLHLQTGIYLLKLFSWLFACFCQYEVSVKHIVIPVHACWHKHRERERERKKEIRVTHTHTHTHACKYTSMHAHTSAYMHACTHACTHSDAHTHACMHTHKHTQTHNTHRRFPSNLRTRCFGWQIKVWFITAKQRTAIYIQTSIMTNRHRSQFRMQTMWSFIQQRNKWLFTRNAWKSSQHSSNQMHEEGQGNFSCAKVYSE